MVKQFETGWYRNLLPLCIPARHLKSQLSFLPARGGFQTGDPAARRL